jgi:hypothetical protein
MKLHFFILFLVCSCFGCTKSPDYSRFQGLVDRVYIEDGSGGLIMFTPYGDGPPIKNNYVYKDIKKVFLKIENGWAEIYIPEHRTKYVLPAARIVRFDLIVDPEDRDRITPEYEKSYRPLERDVE